MESASPPLQIDRGATVDRIQLDETSWVDVARQFVRSPEALLTTVLEQFTWQESTVWRYEVSMTEPRLNAQVRTHQLPDAVRQAGLHLASKYRVRFDGPDILRYRNGNDSVAFHRDRSMRWLEDTLIGIVVLGEPRPFVLRPHGLGRDDVSSDVDVRPGRGDLIVMGGRAQADWLHAVPKIPRATERVSFTWRWTAKSGPPDESAPYNAARNFSDTGRAGPQRRR